MLLDTEESILVAAPVETTFDHSASGGGGTVTHYLLSAVPLSEIFEPVKEMVDLINGSTVQVLTRILQESYKDT